jgi:hypothetical protein
VPLVEVVMSVLRFVPSRDVKPSGVRHRAGPSSIVMVFPSVSQLRFDSARRPAGGRSGLDPCPRWSLGNPHALPSRVKSGKSGQIAANQKAGSRRISETRRTLAFLSRCGTISAGRREPAARGARTQFESRTPELTDGDAYAERTRTAALRSRGRTTKGSSAVARDWTIPATSGPC